jgi:bacterioferritin-associated ferredoxin
MLVCHCRGVTDRMIRDAVQAGAETLDAVSAACGAAGGCGGCADLVLDVVCAERLVRRAATEAPADSEAA